MSKTLKSILEATLTELGEGHDDDIRRVASEMRSSSLEANRRRVAFGELIAAEADQAKNDPDKTVADIRKKWAGLLDVSDGEIRRILGVTRALRVIAEDWSKVPATILEGSWRSVPDRCREALGKPLTTTEKDNSIKAHIGRVAVRLERAALRSDTPRESLQEAVTALRNEAKRLNRLIKEMETANEPGEEAA